MDLPFYLKRKSCLINTPLSLALLYVPFCMMPTNSPTLSIIYRKSASSRACFPTSGFLKICWRCRASIFEIKHISDLHLNSQDRIRPSVFGTSPTGKNCHESKAASSIIVCTRKKPKTKKDLYFSTEENPAQWYLFSK